MTSIKQSTAAVESPAHRRIELDTVTEDPFTWPFWVKIGIMANICANVFLNNVSAAGLVPILGPLSIELDLPITQASHIMSYNVLAQGLSNVIWVPTMLCLGKRWTILGTMILLLPCIAWTASATSYNSILAARVLAGFASGASESFAPVIIGEIWYEHDLTTALGFFTFSLTAGVGLGQLCLGYVTQGAGWRWAVWVTFIACSVNFVTMLLWLPETTYQRGLEIGTTAGDVQRSDLLKHGKEEDFESTTRTENMADLSVVATTPELKTMRSNLWFLRHSHIDYRQNWLLCLIRPLKFFASIPITWSSLAYAVSAGGFTAAGVCIPQLSGVSPYNFKSGAQGLFGMSGLIGAMIGGILGSRVVDTFNGYVEKRRFKRGQDHSPEARLMMTVIPFLTTSTGLIVFGYGFDQRMAWIVPAVGYAIHSFGFNLMAGITYSYAVDSYLVRSGQAMVFNNVIRALISFGFMDSMPNFVVKVGAGVAYTVLAAVIWAVTVFAVPIYFFGPKLRAKSNKFL